MNKKVARTISRRQMLALIGLTAVSPGLMAINFERRLLKQTLRQYLRPSNGARTEQKGSASAAGDTRVLVLVHLAGGNDGLNTVVPLKDKMYRKARPTLSLSNRQIIEVTEEVGLNANLAGLVDQFEQKKLAIVQGVGYERPNRSHFRSLEIWETGSRSTEELETGWLARHLSNSTREPDDPTPQAIHMGSEIPEALYSPDAPQIFGVPSKDQRVASRVFPGDFTNIDALTSESNLAYVAESVAATANMEKEVLELLQDDKARRSKRYPDSRFSRKLLAIANLINAGLATPVYHLQLGGFDTHANQDRKHAKLLKTLSEGLSAFQDDLDERGIADNVLTMTYSEFGRRPWENKSGGTDHGTAAPLFLMGPAVNGGAIGSSAPITANPKADLPFTTDFKNIYATVLKDWFSSDPKKVLGGHYPTLPVINSGA